MPNGWPELSQFCGGALVGNGQVLEVPGWRGRKRDIECRNFAIAFGISASDVRRGEYWLTDKEGVPLLLVRWTGPNWPTSDGRNWSGRASKAIFEAMAAGRGVQAESGGGR